MAISTSTGLRWPQRIRRSRSTWACVPRARSGKNYSAPVRPHVLCRRRRWRTVRAPTNWPSRRRSGTCLMRSPPSASRDRPLSSAVFIGPMPTSPCRKRCMSIAPLPIVRARARIRLRARRHLKERDLVALPPLPKNAPFSAEDLAFLNQLVQRSTPRCSAAGCPGFLPVSMRRRWCRRRCCRAGSASPASARAAHDPLRQRERQCGSVGLQSKKDGG